MNAKIIQNAPLPENCRSWLDYYFKHSGADTRLLYCAVYACPTPPVTAVLMESHGFGRFAVPVCDRHRHVAEEVELYQFSQIAPLE